MGAVAIDKEIILPSPLRVLEELISLAPTADFLSSVAATFFRGLEAFILSGIVGAVAGFASGRSPTVKAALAPLLTTIRATPVLALILLALLWFPSGFVPIFSAFLMAFPVMAASAMQGAMAAPHELLEMASLFKVPRSKVFFQLRLPAAAPYFAAGARASLGLSWKVVVAGEVLAQPRLAIGSGLQSSRVLLETPRVFAWAFAAILLCGLTEWLFGRLVAKGASHGL
ncbi:MAG TPA: ABC transporter permease subunit [Rectinemataceae bacterium]|nr:ABC transporter permease subunit [Rectinemataceae bacterium]